MPPVPTHLKRMKTKTGKASHISFSKSTQNLKTNFHQPLLQTKSNSVWVAYTKALFQMQTEMMGTATVVLMLLKYLHEE